MSLIDAVLEIQPNSFYDILFEPDYLRRAWERRIYLWLSFRNTHVPAHAELFGLLHLFPLYLEEFDYTVRIQHVLRTTGYS